MKPMQICKGDLRDVKVKRIKKFAFKAYDFLNGKINPVYPARKLIFYKKPSVEYLNEEKTDVSIFGQCVYDHIALNPYGMKDWLLHNIPNGADEIDLRTLIICITAHELSHLDQKYKLWDRDGFESKYPFKNTIEAEVANEINTVIFLENYYNLISANLGKFDIDLYKDITAYNPSKIDHPTFYGKIADIRDRTLEILSIVSGLNFIDLIKSDYFNGIDYIKINIFKDKGKNDSVSFPTDYLYSTMNQYLMDEIKYINAMLIDGLLVGYKADVFVDILTLDTGALTFIIDCDAYSKSYTVLKDSLAYKATLHYDNESTYNKRVKEILDAYHLY